MIGKSARDACQSPFNPIRRSGSTPMGRARSAHLTPHSNPDGHKYRVFMPNNHRQTLLNAVISRACRLHTLLGGPHATQHHLASMAPAAKRCSPLSHTIRRPFALTQARRNGRPLNCP